MAQKISRYRLALLLAVPCALIAYSQLSFSASESSSQAQSKKMVPLLANSASSLVQHNDKLASTADQKTIRPTSHSENEEPQDTHVRERPSLVSGFVLQVKRSGFAEEAQQKLAEHIMKRMTDTQGKIALQWLEDMCGELHFAATEGLNDTDSQTAYTKAMESRGIELYTLTQERPEEGWEYVSDLMFPYLYTCMTEFPRVEQYLKKEFQPFYRDELELSFPTEE